MNSVAKHARFSAKTQYTALNHNNTFLLLRRDEKISAGEMYNSPLTLGRRVWIVQQRSTATSAHRTPPSTLSSLSHKRIVVTAGGLDLKEPKNGGVIVSSEDYFSPSQTSHSFFSCCCVDARQVPPLAPAAVKEAQRCRQQAVGRR